MGGRAFWSPLGAAVRDFITRPKSILALTFVGFAALAFCGYYVNQNLKEAHRENLESSIWVIGQIEPRALRFQLALERYLADAGDSQLRSQVQMQAEMLINRIVTVDTYMRDSNFKLDEDLASMWQRVRLVPASLDPLVETWSVSEPDHVSIARSISEEFHETLKLIRAFNIKSMAQAVTQQGIERRSLQTMSRQFAIISFVLIGFLLFAILMLLKNASVLARRGRELREARDAAVEAAESRTRFFAVMSHEMRTPISSVIAAIDALRVTTRTNEKQLQLADIADRSARTALEQINNVLDLAWLEKGDSPETYVIFNITDAIEDLASQVRPMALRSGNTIELDLPDKQEAFVRGPRRIFMRPLQNLIGNALKFNTNGTISVRAALHGGWARVEVEDDGPGISEDRLESIFEPFESLGNGKTQEAAGTGLGLMIARQAVEGMGGRIGASSAPGCGAHFWFEIPLEPVARQELQVQIAADLEHGATSRDAVDLEPHRVLLVEDDESSRMLASECLRHFGQDVTEAHDGEEAVRLAREQHFDVILMDVNMPRMNGEEATRLIRENSLCRTVPIIGVSAFGSAEEISAFLSCGMNRVLPKPLTSREIIRLFSRERPWRSLGDDVPSLTQIVPHRSLERARESLLREVRTIIEALRDQPGRAARNGLSGDVHRAKGLASLLGYDGFTEILSELDRALRNAPESNIDDLLHRLTIELNNFPPEEWCGTEEMGRQGDDEEKTHGADR